MALLLLGCQRQGDASSGEEQPPNDEQPDPAPGAGPVAPGWHTTEWAMQRGAPDLAGRVRDEVIRNPEIEWSVELDGPIVADAGIANGKVFVGTIIGTVYALDAETGDEVWTFAAEDTIEAAPTIAAGRVFIGSNDGFFYCLDEATGKLQWKEEGHDKMLGGATVLAGPDGGLDRILFNGHDGIVRCRKIADGAEVWSHDAGDNINGSPGLVEEKFVVFGGCASVVHVLDLDDGELVNEVVTDAEVMSWVASVGPMVYFANHANQVVGADAFGEELKWVYEDRDFPFFSNPAVDGERVYIGSRDKHLHAIGRESGKLEWKFKTGSRVDGSAVVFDDAVVFGSGDGRLYALDPKDGAEIWRLDLGEGVAASPAFANGRLVIGGDDGTLFAIKEGQANIK